MNFKYNFLDSSLALPNTEIGHTSLLSLKKCETLMAVPALDKCLDSEKKVVNLTRQILYEMLNNLKAQQLTLNLQSSSA